MLFRSYYESRPTITIQKPGADNGALPLDGRFALHGRADRIVKIEEKRISLDAIEALLTVSTLVTTARLLVCAPVPGQRVEGARAGERPPLRGGKLRPPEEIRHRGERPLPAGR